MPKLKIPFPLPDSTCKRCRRPCWPRRRCAVLRRVYGLELDYSPASLVRLEQLAREKFRLGRYRPESFPTTLALAIGAYLAEMLRRHIDHCRWGEIDEDLYSTPLPFLVFSRAEYERQVNVVEDLLYYLWRGTGPSLPEYFACSSMISGRLGFAIREDPKSVSLIHESQETQRRKGQYD